MAANASDYKQFIQEYKLLCNRYKLQVSVSRRKLSIGPKTTNYGGLVETKEKK